MHDSIKEHSAGGVVYHNGKTLAIKWLLIDIGHVLLLKDTGKSFTELLANELGVYTDLAQEINKAHYTTMETQYVSEETFVADLETKLGYKAPEDIFSYFARAYEKQVRPNTELFAYLKEARDSGMKTAILSNTTAIYRPIQRQLGITKEDGFDPILYSWEVEMRKPNRDIFELALQKLDAKPDEVIFIDDKLEHLQGAQQVGIKTVLFDNTESVISQLRNM